MREKAEETVTISPDSVGYAITKKALVFSGDTRTATHIAVHLGMAGIGCHRNLSASRCNMERLKSSSEQQDFSR